MPPSYAPHPHQHPVERLQEVRPIRLAERRLAASQSVHPGAQVFHGRAGDRKALRGRCRCLAASKLLPPKRTRCYNTRMNKPLKITQIGNSAGIVLPKDVLAHLNLSQGDEVSVVKQADGIALKSADPDFDKQMSAARDVMARYRNALRELAK